MVTDKLFPVCLFHTESGVTGRGTPIASTNPIPLFPPFAFVGELIPARPFGFCKSSIVSPWEDEEV